MNGNNAEKPTPTAEPATEATNQPPAAELLSNDQFSQYLLRSKSEMFSVFRGLVERVSQVTMFFNEGKDMILTSIVSYDDSGIVLDLGASGEMNRKALEANKLFCVTQLDKVKVQFLLLGVKRIEVGGQPAFKAPLPETVLRLQRREYFRLTTPIARPLKCQITIPDVGVIEAQVADISGGGIGLMGIPLTVKIEPGMDFSNCKIDLPEVGTVVATVQIRSVFETTTRSGVRSKRAGCQFVNLPGPMMTLIQRYIIKVERERKARESGMV